MNGETKMLQISSGKFFNTDELYITERTAVLYSNFKYHSVIETSIGKLEPIFYGNDNVETYLFKYENRMPKSGFLIAVGEDVIIEQFIYLCSIKLNSVFSRSLELVKTYCNNNPKESELRDNPLSLVPNFFNKKNEGSDNEVEKFIESVKKTIDLPRKVYLSVMACYRNAYHSLLNLNTNVDLAYSQLVYCLESLAQNFDGYSPRWEDYEQNVRVQLDTIFSSIDNNLSENIRNVLLKSANLKSQSRFINYIIQNVDDVFFQDEAYEAKYAIKKLDLRIALINTYNQRSRFVHALETMKKEATMPRMTIGETFQDEENPFLTYRGLVRLTLHVISNVVKKQPSIEKENYNWHDELPNLVQIKLAESYWLGNTTGFKQEFALSKFEGFISYLTTMIQNKNNTFEFDLTSLLLLYEKLIPTSKMPNKLDMYALYVLYHKFIAEEFALPNHKLTIEKYNYLFHECSIQAMVVSLFNQDIWNWDATTSEATFMKYKKQSYKKNRLTLPNTIEVTLLLTIANIYLYEDNQMKYKEVIVTAINQLPGFKKLQDKLFGYLKDCAIVHLNMFSSEDEIAETLLEYYI
jgi:hypothetical protein